MPLKNVWFYTCIYKPYCIRFWHWHQWLKQTVWLFHTNHPLFDSPEAVHSQRISWLNHALKFPYIDSLSCQLQSKLHPCFPKSHNSILSYINSKPQHERLVFLKDLGFHKLYCSPGYSFQSRSRLAVKLLGVFRFPQVMSMLFLGFLPTMQACLFGQIL